MVHSVSESLVLESRPALVQRFETVRHLGDGAAGSVFLVRDRKRNDMEVALKILINGNAFDENTIARFEQELEASQSVEHPNLVKAYDYIELGDTIAFTMEYVEGKDLGVTFNTRPLSYEEVDVVFEQLLSAMEELHRNGIIHRDIKLENIILCMDGTVKLSDLGLMKRLNSDGMTRTGVLLGTAQYLPPEYIKNAQYDERGDIYSAGTVLLELLTHKRRLSDKPGMEAIEHLIKTRFAVPKLVMAGLPRRYVEIISKALAHNPDDRFQSAAEMYAAFQTPNTIAESYVGEQVAVSNVGLSDSPVQMQHSAGAPERHGRRIRLKLIMRITLVVVALLLTIFTIMTWRTYDKFDLFEFGLYRGKLVQGENTWPLEMRVDQRGVFIRSGMEGCKGGQLNRFMGTINCGQSFKFEIGNIVNGRYMGQLKDKSSGAVYKWSVKEVEQQVLR